MARDRLRWFGHRVRARLGLRVAAEQLESGSKADFVAYYSSRVTDCSFVNDPHHYEYPRGRWLLDRPWAGVVLEIGCGNGGFTRQIAPLVEQVVALDVSRPSLDELRALELPNVTTVESLVEDYLPAQRFDRVLMSEVIEHVKDPQLVISRALMLLRPGGELLLTTPYGRWESHEHLHEFDAPRLARLLFRDPAEQISVGYLRDGDGKRRWLTAEVVVSWD